MCNCIMTNIKNKRDSVYFPMQLSALKYEFIYQESSKQTKYFDADHS